MSVVHCRKYLYSFFSPCNLVCRVVSDQWQHGGSFYQFSSFSGVPSHDVNRGSFYVSVCLAILFFLTFSFHAFLRASHHSPFHVALSPHVQNISQLLMPPLIPVSIDVFVHQYTSLSQSMTLSSILSNATLKSINFLPVGFCHCPDFHTMYQWKHQGVDQFHNLDPSVFPHCY